MSFAGHSAPLLCSLKFPLIETFLIFDELWFEDLHRADSWAKWIALFSLWSYWFRQHTVRCPALIFLCSFIISVISAKYCKREWRYFCLCGALNQQLNLYKTVNWGNFDLYCSSKDLNFKCRWQMFSFMKQQARPEAAVWGRPHRAPRHGISLMTSNEVDKQRKSRGRVGRRNENKWMCGTSRHL